MTATVNSDRVSFKRDPMLYGHFLEHFHRQTYGGVFDPNNPLSDGDGLRTDVIEAMRRIRVPILRWPGGCYVSNYHWQDGVGKTRVPFYDKAWRVEDPNTFGTDEYIKLCQKVGCAPYICTNAGTGTPEEMSDWVEYCNLANEGKFARMRIANGCDKPHDVRYWSIGNENYGSWELGAKSADEWGRLVREAAKLMLRVDPDLELSAAALTDPRWNLNLLENCGQYLRWISIHKYWNGAHQLNDLADYDECMAYTDDLDTDIKKVRGLLMALGLERSIRIAYDEWNLRGWHHPNITPERGEHKYEDVILPRDRNDLNASYTMADAVFSACFLNTLNRNADIIGMANFAPIVNTRGCIYTYDKGIVLRPTYHVYDLYVNHMGDEIVEQHIDCDETMRVPRHEGGEACVPVLDVLFTRRSYSGALAVSAINKHASEPRTLTLRPEDGRKWSSYRVLTLNGDSPDAYNDVDVNGVSVHTGEWLGVNGNEDRSEINIELPPHSVNVVEIVVG